MSFALTKDALEDFQKAFDKDPKNRLAQNVCTKVDLKDVLVSCAGARNTAHVFSHKVDPEGKPGTNQKCSGICWLFAYLNATRIPMMRHYELEEFEFSQSYLFFWDKVERCNFFLNNMVTTARKGEPVDGRLMSFLLYNPTEDGGQWHMLCNIVKKYGLVPKKNFPESFCSESTMQMNATLKSKLREYARDLRQMVESGASDGDIAERIKGMTETCYRIVSICLGSPPSTFTWEYYNKNKTYCKVGPITPVEFYEKHVKQLFNVDDKICLVNDPRPTCPYENTYTVEYLGNMVGGQEVIYVNQPIEVLMQAVVDSIKENEAVWFGCQIQKRFDRKRGIQDLTLHEYDLMFGTSVTLGLSKAERLLYGESMMSHAMVFTGVSLDDDNNPVKFRVENSWGDDIGNKGYLAMTQEWFKEFTFEVVVDKKFVSPGVLSVANKDPKVLPAWDPMGALAA
uniref:Bleomycin hydrolase n=1 Tax=Ornithodoros turicata TaxID=34597 RepID=A0A2R5LC70_9ACAR